jgi:hypothetical protein
MPPCCTRRAALLFGCRAAAAWISSLIHIIPGALLNERYDNAKPVAAGYRGNAWRGAHRATIRRWPAIPLLPEVLAGQTLTGTGYRQILTDRVAWMVGLLPEREQMRAVSRLQPEMELRERWMATQWSPDQTILDRVQALLVDNPMWPDYLNLVVETPKWPATLETNPAAVEAIQETSVAEWFRLASLPIHSLE